MQEKKYRKKLVHYALEIHWMEVGRQKTKVKSKEFKNKGLTVLLEYKKDQYSLNSF